MNRSNDIWVQDLRDGGVARNQALTDLQRVLMVGLRKAFWDNNSVDNAFLEDVIQEALVKIVENVGQFEGRSRFTTWATSVAVRLAFTELRRKRWKDISLDQVLEGAGQIPHWAVDPALEPAQAAQRQDLIQKMYQMIESDLTKKQRDALLAELKGMPQEEIGRRMGSNRNAIYKLTHDARKRLKESLEAGGITLSDVQAAFGE